MGNGVSERILVIFFGMSQRVGESVCESFGTFF